jgi:hypothetical protein
MACLLHDELLLLTLLFHLLVDRADMVARDFRSLLVASVRRLPERKQRLLALAGQATQLRVDRSDAATRGRPRVGRRQGEPGAVSRIGEETRQLLPRQGGRRIFEAAPAHRAEESVPDGSPARGAGAPL